MESFSSKEDNTVISDSDERNKLLLRIKELEGELLEEKKKSNNVSENGEIDKQIENSFNDYVENIDGTINYSFQILDNKDVEIRKLNDKIIENNAKWKNYVKLLLEQIGKKNAIIDRMKEDINTMVEKNKNQELINRENGIKLTSYEELLQLDQQLLKQNKQVETELKSIVDKLQIENKKYINAIKSVSESSKKRNEEYNKRINQQELMINNLLSIVENFRGRYLYNNIGRQKGIINQINRKSKFYDKNDNDNSDKMNPLEYEFGILWKSSQTKIIERKYELYETILNIREKEKLSKYLDDENIYMNNLLDANAYSSDGEGNVPITELIFMYSNFLNRIMGLYEIFSNCNLLMQYFQFKALRYLQINHVSKFILNGEFTGIIHWICNIVIVISKLIISLGKILIKMRTHSSNSNDLKTTIFQKLPCLNSINNIISWINGTFHCIMNDELNQNYNYEQVIKFNDKLNEFQDSSTNNDLMFPLCCIDAVLNINISLSIISSLYIKQVDIEKYDNIYKISLNVSEKFYSKCGTLILNGVHYPFDYRIYSWESLYWNNIFDHLKTPSFTNLFKDMLSSQLIICNYIDNNNSGDNNISSHIEVILNGVKELESNIEKIIIPIHIIDRNDEIEDENKSGTLTDIKELSVLPELLISRNIQQKLLYQLDDQMLEKEEKSDELEKQNSNEDFTTSNQVSATGNANLESPKRTRMENTIRSLNEKLQTLKKELTGKNVLYSSFGVMDVEFRKLQDFKQTLMQKVKEQETDISLKKQQIFDNETTIKRLRYEIESLKQNIENLNNLPKIKAYSELDVLEPVYLRRMVRIMNNRLYEIEMNRWNETLVEENPNEFFKYNFDKKLLLSHITNENSKISDIIKKLSKNSDQEQDVSTFVELLYIVNQYRELKRQVLLHKCSIPIYSNGSNQDKIRFQQEWEEYVKRESDLKYKLYIMKKTLKELLLDLKVSTSENVDDSNTDIVKNKIGKIKLKLPYTDSVTSRHILNDGNVNSLEINTREWNDIVHSVLKR